MTNIYVVLTMLRAKCFICTNSVPKVGDTVVMGIYRGGR